MSCWLMYIVVDVGSTIDVYIIYMDVSENSGTPKSSILIGFSIKPSILVYPYFWKHPYRHYEFHNAQCASMHFF